MRASYFLRLPLKVQQPLPVLVGLHGGDFGGEAGLQRTAERLRQVHVHDPLGASQRLGRLRGQPLGESTRLGHQLFGRDLAAGESQFHRGRGRDAIAGEEVFARAHDRCQQRPERGAAVTGDQPHGDVRVGQVRGLRDEHDVAQQRHAAAEPDRRAVDRRDDRQREAQHLLDDLCAFANALVASDRIVEKRSDPVQVATGAERAPRAGQDDDLGLCVGRQLPPDIGQGPVQVLVDTVELGSPVDQDGSHRTVSVDGQLVRQVVFHRILPRQ